MQGYAAHERETFESVTKARAQAEGATGVGGQADAENAVTTGLRQLLAVAENYPDLKANTNFLALQEELTGTESKIAYARQYYNDQVRLLNTAIQSFPSSILASMFHFTAARVLRHRRRGARARAGRVRGILIRARTDRAEQAQDVPAARRWRCCSPR